MASDSENSDDYMDSSSDEDELPVMAPVVVPIITPGRFNPHITYDMFELQNTLDAVTYSDLTTGLVNYKKALQKFTAIIVGSTNKIVIRNYEYIHGEIRPTLDIVKVNVFLHDHGFRGFFYKEGDLLKKCTLKSMLNQIGFTREFSYRGVIAHPYHVLSKEPKEHFFNISQPYVCSIAPDGWEDNVGLKLYMEHIEKVWASGDPHIAKWQKSWLAHVIAKPGIKIGVAMILIGTHGAGKNYPIEVIRRFVMGEAICLYTNGLERITGKFNSILMGKSLINIDEPQCQSVGGFHAMNEIIKSLITNPDITIEPKGKDPITVQDSANYLGTTNNENAFSVATEDRRYAMFTVSSDYASDRPYHNNLRKETNNQEFGNVLFNWAIQYVKSDEYIDVTDQTNIPMTLARKNAMEMSKSSSVIFIEEFVDTIENFRNIDSTIDNEITIPNKDLYVKYKVWCTDTNSKTTSDRYFWPAIKTYVIHSRPNGIRSVTLKKTKTKTS